MSLPKYLPHYTLADHRQWEGDWELWDGVPVAMTPSPFGPHQKLVAKLAQRLLNAIDAAACDDCTVVVELDWIVNDETVVRPDISVVCNADLDRFIETPPSLVVEVLSDSTEHKDRTAKFELYQSQGVRYYLMIDSRDGTSELHSLNESGRYRSMPVAGHIPLQLHTHCEIQLTL
ncbi:MAG: Uma2 family endonuclease [Planctomycetaceae bacterium]